MAATVRKVRLGAKDQVVVLKEVRQALGLKPGGSFAFVIDGEDVHVVRTPAEADDPFACFCEWASEADRKGYGDL
jgi:bifunctional DNA-binding transcriptional regulator/antitoxin component of YhaV-PrlF toxin-antitoxin module